MRPRALALSLALVAACRSAPEAGRPLAEDYPGELRAPASLGADVFWRQHVIARWGEGDERGFDAVVQKRGDELTVLGLSPAGTTGFSIVLAPGGVELVNRMPEDFPFDPRFVLLDVQRAYYPWLPGPDALRVPGRNGAFGGVVDGERVDEVWFDGRLVERRFERLDGEPAGSIVVQYEWEEGDVPSNTQLQNGWFGYALSIETLEAEVLAPGAVEANARGDA